MTPALDLDAPCERIELDGGSWIDIARGWLRDPDELYAFLEANVRWQQDKVWRYEKYVESPRLGAGFVVGTSPHPILVEAQRAIEKRYGARFDSFGLQYYRNNRDSVGMHRDREMRWLDNTVVAILTTGAQRPFLVQRRDAQRAERDLSPASGDLMVFGGRFQADWLHGVPKVHHAVRGRISAQWRYTTKTGRRDTNPGFYAPREFSKGNAMSIRVDVSEVATIAARQAPFAYLLTVSNDASAHAVAISPAIGDGVITCDAGRTSCANAQARPKVSLLWPPAEPTDYSLIVDGVAEVDGSFVRIMPDRAVRHRPAPGGGNDCVPLQLQAEER